MAQIHFGSGRKRHTKRHKPAASLLRFCPRVLIRKPFRIGSFRLVMKSAGCAVASNLWARNTARRFLPAWSYSKSAARDERRADVLVLGDVRVYSGVLHL